MKLLIINSEYPPVGGGASNASANISRLMAKDGNDVAVLTSKYGDYPKDIKEDGVRILRGPAKRKFQDRSNATEQLLFILLGGFRSIKFVKKWRPDMVFAFFGIPSGVIGLMLKVFFGIPYIVSLRGGDVPGFREEFAIYHKLMAPLLRAVWKNAEHIVANSQGLRQLALEFESKYEISVIPNGVDIELFAQNERQWDPPHLLLVGRIVHQKGIDILLEALNGLKELIWDLIIVGDGPERRNYQEMIDRFGLEDRVRFVEWKNKKELLKYYQNSNIYVYPSRNEGMPNVVLEAMACGLPVLASNISGNEELVLPGKTGELFPPDSPEKLKEELLKLIPDSNKRQKFGENARKFIEENYSWENTSEQYLTLFKSILERD